jgi:hypothetical protein
MTEADARVLLRDCDGLGGLEALLAAQPWRAVPGGWEIVAPLQGWRVRLEPTAQGVRIHAGEPGSRPAFWLVRRAP